MGCNCGKKNFVPMGTKTPTNQLTIKRQGTVKKNIKDRSKLRSRK